MYKLIDDGSIWRGDVYEVIQVWLQQPKKIKVLIGSSTTKRLFRLSNSLEA